MRDDGTILVPVLDTVGQFMVSSVVNDFGQFWITLPKDFNLDYLKRDYRVVFWRKPAGGSMYIEFSGLMRTFITEDDENGNTIHKVGGPSLEYLLSSRVINADPTSALATQTDVADDMIKTFVTNHLGASAGSRAISSTYFSVAANAGLGPTITMTVPYRNLLDVLKDISNAARLAGTETYFRMRPTGNTTFILETQTGQPGIDRTATNSGLIFGKEFGNLTSPKLVEDWMGESNYVYGLGQMSGTAYNVQPAEDTSRSTGSVFALREGVAQINAEDSASILSGAQKAVIENRPVKQFTGQPQSVDGAIYGKDWDKFDKVNTTYNGLYFPSVIRGTTVTVDASGKEDIQATMEAYL